MDDNKSNSPLPDISGVFNVSDSDIPDRLLEKPDSRRQKTDGVILGTDREDKEKQLERQRTVRRRGNAKKKKMLRRRRITAAVICFIVLVITVLSVKAAVANSKRPEVELYTVTVGDVRKTYDSASAVMTAAIDGSPISTYAIIPENSYDLYDIKTGQRAVITNKNGVSYDAHVTHITEENAGTPVSESVKTALPDKTFSAASNIFIYVKPDAPMNEADGTVLSVCIITAEELNVTFVPEKSIFHDKSGDFVWTAGRISKKLTKKYVTVSLTANGNTSIIGGLKKNERVVSDIISDTAVRPLENGVKIKAVTPKITDESETQ